VRVAVSVDHYGDAEIGSVPAPPPPQQQSLCVFGGAYFKGARCVNWSEPQSVSISTAFNSPTCHCFQSATVWQSASPKHLWQHNMILNKLQQSTASCNSYVTTQCFASSSLLSMLYLKFKLAGGGGGCTCVCQGRDVCECPVHKTIPPTHTIVKGKGSCYGGNYRGEGNCPATNLKVKQVAYI
jgi:hypothetical protein